MRDWADGLPEELLSLMLSKLFAKDRHTFSLVCKSWYKAAKFSPYCNSPCLMYYHRGKCAWKLFQYNSFFSIKLPEQVTNAEIRCTKYGWMLMSRNDLSLFFYDPFNNETIDLPEIDFQYPSLCFFHPPTSPDCFIVAIGNVEGSKDSDIGVLKRGEKEWEAYSYPSNTLFLPPVNCAPVLHRGLVYYLDVQGNVGTLDVNEKCDEKVWVVKTRCLFPARLRKNVRHHFLAKLHDEQVVLAVLVAHDGKKVNVFRLVLEPKKKWVLVEDLVDKVLFVSRTASFAATAPCPSMANRIYFPKTYGDDNVVYYSLATRKYHSSSGDYSSNKSYGLKDLSFATWIMPRPTPETPTRDWTWFP